MKKEKIAMLIMIICTAIVGLFCGGKYVYAKYVLSKSISIPITTSDYYFEAKADKTIFTSTPATVKFTTKNYDASKCTSKNLKYTISSTTPTKLDIAYANNKTSGELTGGTNSEGTISATISKKSTASLPIEEDIVFTIKVTEPYVDEIKITVKMRLFDTDRYAKNGLVLMLDGENNTGIGHSKTATTWKDLSGNENNATLANFNNTSRSGWFSNGIAFDGKDDTGTIKDNATIKPTSQTIEILLQKDADATPTARRSIFFVKWYGYTMEWMRDNTVCYGRTLRRLFIYTKCTCITKKILNYRNTYRRKC